MNRNFLLLSLFTLAFWSCMSEKPAPGEQVWIDEGYTNKVVDGYWLYLPRSFTPERSWPVILFLQGGYGVSPNPETSRNDGPAKFARLEGLSEQLASYVKDSFLIINPHMKVGPKEKRQWFQYDKTLMHIVQEVSQNYQGDPERWYLTGLSRGGHGSWGLAKKHPNKFAAMVEISGRITCTNNCEKLMEIPIWIIHNSGDKQVKYRNAIQATQYFRENLGITFDSINTVILEQKLYSRDHLFTTFLQEGHDAWNKAYSTPDIYKWLLMRSK